MLLDNPAINQGGKNTAFKCDVIIVLTNRHIDLKHAEIDEMGCQNVNSPQNEACDRQKTPSQWHCHSIYNTSLAYKHSH